MAERDRFSLLGHRDLETMSPLTTAELERLLGRALEGSGARPRVLELGAGRGDVSRLAASRFGAHVEAIEQSLPAVELARERCRGLDVDVVAGDASAELAHRELTHFELTIVVGALQIFGHGRVSWVGAHATLGASRRVLLGDMVALGPAAKRTFDVAHRDELAGLEDVALDAMLLPPPRVVAYEEAWCAAVETHLRAHPDDPRAAWGRERLAWSASVRDAFREVAFLALVLPGAAR